VSTVTKAVVLARGAGTRMKQRSTVRLRPDQAAAADAGAKAMMPLVAGGASAGRPFLDYVLSGLADAGFESICLVIAPDHVDTRRYYQEVAPPRRARVRFVAQAEPRGTADAVVAAADFIARDCVLVINGDNYYPSTALARLRALEGPGTMLFRAHGLVANGNIPADRVEAFAIGTIDPDGYLLRLIEKPTADALRDAGPNPLVSMNCWLMPPEIVEACRSVRPSSRGELELTHAVSDAIDDLGIRFRVLVSDEGVLDLSRRDDVDIVSAHLASIDPQP
jgi:dTDP-glucose pyrophosphorylase